MEGTDSNLSILGIDPDLPLASEIKEEVTDPLETLADNSMRSVTSVPQDEPNVPGASETAESPTTGDGTSLSGSLNSKCVFCNQAVSVSDEPKLLECLHCACGPCVSKECEQNQANVENPPEGQLVCRLCHMSTVANQIIENQFLIELSGSDDSSAETADKIGDIKCSSCNDDAPATSWCVECSEYICDNCVQAHQRLKITKDHTIKLKEDAAQENQTSASSSVPKSMVCSIHSHERLSLFCVTCDKLTCRDCQLTDHREHKYKFINEIADETRATMANLLKDVTYKRILLSSAMTVIDDRQKLIHDKKMALVREITQMVVKLTNTINIRGKQLVMRLNEVCDSKQKTLNEKKKALDQLSMLTDHCVTFVQRALEKGSDMALLHAKRHVLKHLNRIKCRRADIPNPEIPVRISLALDKVPELIKVVSLIGAIVVDGKVYPPSNNMPHQSPSPQAVPSVSPLSQVASSQQQQQQQQQQMNCIVQSPPSQVFGPPPQNRPGAMGMMQRPPVPVAIQRNPNAMVRSPFHAQAALQAQQQMMRLPGASSQQVTSSTHPQALGNTEAINPNLRGLLQTHSQANVPQQNYAPPQQQQQVYPPQPNPQQSYPPNSQQAMFRLRVQTNQPYRQPPPYNSYHQQQQRTMKYMGQGYYPQQQMQQPPTHPPPPLQQQQPQTPQQQAPRMMIGANQMGQLRQLIPRPQNQQQPMMPNQGYVQQQQLQHQQSQQQQQSSHQVPSVQWHVPQQGVNGVLSQHNGGQEQQYAGGSRQMQIRADNSFKITLNKLPSQTPPTADIQAKSAAVTSTIPTTPSPNAIQSKADDTERNLDKYCEDSVNDLMATIAKLDSNGVQVLAEGRAKGGSPHVDSSTGSSERQRGSTSSAGLMKNQMNEVEKDDPNEDWCAVCMDGGELVCCDKCPKVFHQNCHIPNLSVEESDTWQCLLCMNFADVPSAALGEKREAGLSPKEKKIAERLVLELYCQYEPSLHFREVVGAEHTDYHAKIKKPISLDVIRQKLNWSAPGHYQEMVQLIADLRLLFRNAYMFNEKGSVVYEDAKRLEEFLDQQLEKWLPAYAYEDPLREQDTEELFPPLKRYRRIISE